jgi:hypothetical protein
MLSHIFRTIAISATAVAVLGPAAVALASTTTTKTDVATLATAESKVVSLLHEYKPTVAWKLKYEAAVTKQAAILAKVSSDLFATPKVTPSPTTTTTSPPRLMTTTTVVSIPTSTTAGAAGVGSALSFTDERGVPYAVTLSQLIDPAEGADIAPNSGDRYVAAVFVIADTSPSQSTSDDANSDASVVGSDNQTYSADFNDVNGCTNFNNGQYQLNPGQSSTGCVVFQLPTNVNVQLVEWSPTGGFGGNFGEWRAS